VCIFGYAEEGRVFSETYSVFLEKLPKLNDTLNKVFIRVFDSRVPADGVVYHLGRLCVEDFLEILLLCQNGFGFGGLKLLRGLYERTVTMAYIAKNPSEAKTFIDYHHIHRRKELNHAKEAGVDITKHISENVIEDIKRKWDSTKDKYKVEICKKCKTTRIHFSWSNLDLASMAKKVDLGNLFYLKCYYQPTMHEHASLYSIIERIKDGKEIGISDLIFDESAQREQIPITLSYTHTLVLYNLAVQNEFFSLKLDEELKDRLDDYMVCWNNVTSCSQAELGNALVPPS
jgi:hypothetical protein